MIVSEYVEVCCSGPNIQWFRDKGYDAAYHKKIMVKVEDLPPRSTAKVTFRCDYCGKEYTTQWVHRQVSPSQIQKDCCYECRAKKSKENCLLKYGVENVSQLKEVQEKTAQTNLEKYGVRSVLSVQEVIAKRKKTNLERYGFENAALSESVKQKMRETNLERYGVEYAITSEQVQSTITRTCYERYGVKRPLQDEGIRLKTVESAKANGTDCIMYSRQQAHLSELFGGELNALVDGYFVDILLPNHIACEYDGHGHWIRVYKHEMTFEEFAETDILRENRLIGSGYKVIRIVNRHDKNFEDSVYLQAKDTLMDLLTYGKHNVYIYDIESDAYTFR